MKKLISLFLALLMIIPAVISCAEPPSEPNDTDAPAATTVQQNETTTAPETLPPELQDTLPDVKFTGETFTALVRESTSREFFVEDSTGESVNDAVFNRNATVEERFGIKIEMITAPGDWAQMNDFISRVNNSISAQDHEFDMVMTHNAYIQQITLRGLALDMNTLDEIDFSKKWWCQKYVENIAIDGKVYAVMGDIGYTLYEYLECVYFNKELAAKYNIPDLYEIVQAGNWTFEKMMEYVVTVGADLDNDGTYTSEDLYGLSIDAQNCRYAATYWETEMSTLGADGRHTLNLPNERYINCYETLYNAIYNNTQVFFAGMDAYNDTKMFTNDQLLFLTDKLGEASKMRDMDSEYGIVPFPKYDAAQKDYISVTRDAHSGIMIANNIEDRAMVGTIVEALCMYGYTDITPAYYETTLKTRYLKDATAMSMLDLIRDKVNFDFACLYTVPMDYPYSFYGNCITNKTASIASLIKAQSKVWQRNLTKMYEDFDALNK